MGCLTASQPLFKNVVVNPILLKTSACQFRSGLGMSGPSQKNLSPEEAEAAKGAIKEGELKTVLPITRVKSTMIVGNDCHITTPYIIAGTTLLSVICVSVIPLGKEAA